MSIFVSSLFPLVLAGAQAAPAPALPVVTARPAPVAAKPVQARPPIAPAVVNAPQAAQNAPANSPVGGELILAQQTPAPKPAPAPAATTAVSQQAIIDRVNQALSATRTAEGKFSQVDGSGGVQSGVFYIQRPGKIRFEYTTPEPMFIVSDGTSVSIEEPKRNSWDSMLLSQTPLNLFLRSNVDLKKDVKKVETVNGSHFVTLVDRTGEAEGQMTLEFRASDFELLGWRATEGSGSETKVRLSGVQTNVKLKPNLFIVKERDARGGDRR